ncbi:MAG: DUF4118 domain-containing protein [Clostridiales Family XIII bacterium]|jgi:two-component system sensor histidine kinase KdpD|nr:DUF4118 domain-containing protein [Clostridiales Family XIII bacterium]
MKSFFSFNLKDTLITVAVIAAASAICALLREASGSDIYVPLIFVLGVLMVSRLTSGYFYGILTSVLAVFGVNYAFTYPYFALNFSIAGYPVTFATMFVVSVITSALTSQIKQQERLRAEAEREKLYANFLRSVSHDLRTPLTAIAGGDAAILENEGSLPPGQRRALLQDVKENSEWLVGMVENVLSVTRMQGEARLRKTPEALEEVVGGAARKFRVRFPGTELRVTIPGSLVFVPMDATLVEQVLLNLMENAVVHGKTLTYVALTAFVEGGRAEFRVENDGVHIDPVLLKRFQAGKLFVHDEKRPSMDGKRNMGIGLSVCASIIRAHGGAITAENLESGGVAFRFWLPMEGRASHVA